MHITTYCTCIIYIIENEKPEMIDLQRYFIKQYAVYWESLGLELKLEQYHIDIISMNYPRDVVACCKEMLKTWLDTDPSASWGKLDDAVRQIKFTLTATPVSCGGNKGILHSVNISNMLYSLKFCGWHYFGSQI